MWQTRVSVKGDPGKPLARCGGRKQYSSACSNGYAPCCPKKLPARYSSIRWMPRTRRCSHWQQGETCTAPYLQTPGIFRPQTVHLPVFGFKAWYVIL